MPDQEWSQTRLTIDRASFERHFLLEGPGHGIALEALASRIIQTPYEVIDVICRVNQLYGEMLFNRMLEELEPLGRADDYVMAQKLHDSERSASIMIGALGKDRLATIFPEIFRQLREDVLGLRPEDI